MFGTVGHYVENTAGGVHDKFVAWLVEKDPDGMSVAEIDAQLDRLQTLSVEVSKAHTKSDVGKAAYDAAAAQNAIRLKAAENAQAKIEKESPGEKRTAMEAELTAHLDSLQADQAQLDSLKQVSESATKFYKYLEGLFNEKGDRLKTMKARLTVAGNTMKIAKTREQQAAEQAKVVKTHTIVD